MTYSLFYSSTSPASNASTDRSVKKCVGNIEVIIDVSDKSPE